MSVFKCSKMQEWIGQKLMCRKKGSYFCPYGELVQREGSMRAYPWIVKNYYERACDNLWIIFYLVRKYWKIELSWVDLVVI